MKRHLEQLGFADDAARTKSFLEPRLSLLTNPDGMADRQVAARRLASAIRSAERIVVFGDYDCDGMTATAILSEALERLGAASVVPLLASRFAGGYGLSAGALQRVLAERPQLVVTCDCGSSDHASLRVLSEKGIDAIVIDHHLVPEEPLPAVAFLNPHRPDCAFPYKGLASCGLALSVVAAVRAELGVELDIRHWLDLVAVGTIADVAPLDGDNRALVRAGLAQLARDPRPGLLALAEIVGIDRSEPLAASDVSFRLAPRLNAPGRLGSPDSALALLRERDADRARALAAEVEQSCQARREAQKVMEAEAEEDAARHATAHSLVVGRPGWNHGIVGIVAGRLAERLGKPVIVLGFEEGVGRGSVRGPAGFPLFDALSASSDKLTRFGGHQAAAGLELPLAHLEEFRAAFDAACAAQVGYTAPERTAALDVDVEDDLQDLLLDLRELEPCGERNPAPRLRLSGRVRVARELRGGHLKLELELGKERISVFAPGLGASLPPLGQRVSVTGQLRKDGFRGDGSLEFLADRLETEAAG
jgi:single-stranded-DNA-specific exonuclease